MNGYEWIGLAGMIWFANVASANIRNDGNVILFAFEILLFAACFYLALTKRSTQ